MNSSDGVGIVSGAVSRVVSATEYASGESKRFYYILLRRLRSSESRKQKRKDKPVTMQVPMLCDWFCLRLRQPSFSLDRKRPTRKRNQNAVFTRSFLITTPTPSLVKTSFNFKKQTNKQRLDK